VGNNFRKNGLGMKEIIGYFAKRLVDKPNGTNINECSLKRLIRENQKI